MGELYEQTIPFYSFISSQSYINEVHEKHYYLEASKS